MGRGGMHQRMPGVFGTVSSLSGDTIVVSSKAWGPNNSQSGSQASAATSYSVDATNASVMKNGTASSLSAIAVGDTVMVQGTVSGTSVTATKINDGMPQGMPGKGGVMGGKPTIGIQGNGEPVVGGSVSAVNGSSLTVASKAGPTYSVDASAATVFKGNATSSVSAVAVGDNVVVQGTVNGTAVTASSAMDQGAPQSGNASSTAPHGPMGGMGGIFGAIGGFFKNLFGFF